MPLTGLLAVPAQRRDAIARIVETLKTTPVVALTTHINADGDAAGSVSALARLLPQLGVEARIVNPTPWPSIFNYLLGPDINDRTLKGPSALKGVDAIIALDVSDMKRLGSLADTVRAMKVPRIVIDHHVPTDEPAGEIVLDDTDACATAELLFDFAVSLDLEITPAIAEALYTAILTDTGGFRYSNTSPRCHAIAATLLSTGVDPEEVFRRIYASVSPGRLFLLRDSLHSLGHDPAHGISWICVTADALERYDVSPEDLDGIVEHPRSIAGTRMALFFRDLGYGKVKVSFRSTGDVDVNRFARDFGGGGHAKASGALITGTLDVVRDRVVSAARAYVGEVAVAPAVAPAD
ncbi:MAG: bifunctional oligoribonuclease/PAP phosphatase NrnA [Gemmatimonadaceae bacterium]|nr:bifunctional oligoribonuclease/PAP phosphatase NrnA [Gemmatimonadaceae bacterium]